MPSNNGECFEMDIVPVLLENPFKLKPDNEKLAIIEKGRPVPKLPLVQKDKARNCSRTFQPSWYEIRKWLCGSLSYNKLFCWPCLLMRPQSSSWCASGVDDVKRLATMTAKHGICKSHVKAIAEYDSMLAGFNKAPEYRQENIKFEEDEAATETDSDTFENYFNEDSKPKTKDNYMNASNKGDAAEAQTSNSKNQISFKDWQQLNGTTVTSEQVRESHALYKLKRKLLKQELYNAKLKARKMGFEIELLKAKLEYNKHLNAEVEKKPSVIQSGQSRSTNSEQVIASNLITLTNLHG